MKPISTPAGIGADITGTTSLYSAGLLAGGPWNHPFIDNLILPGERTSDTYIQWRKWLMIRLNYHMFNWHECMGVSGEALQLHSAYKKAVFFYCKSRENPYQYYKSRKNKSVSGTASHAHCVWTCNEIEGSHDKIIITIVATKLYREKYPSLICWRWHCRDGNKLLIFSGIPLYYGDNYISSYILVQKTHRRSNWTYVSLKSWVCRRKSNACGHEK